MDEINKLEAEKDELTANLIANWKKMSIVQIIKIKRECREIQEKLDKLYQELD